MRGAKTNRHFLKTYFLIIVQIPFRSVFKASRESGRHLNKKEMEKRKIAQNWTKIQCYPKKIRQCRYKDTLGTNNLIQFVLGFLVSRFSCPMFVLATYACLSWAMFVCPTCILSYVSLSVIFFSFCSQNIASKQFWKNVLYV